MTERRRGRPPYPGTFTPAGAVGIDETGLIKVVDDGCSGSVGEILAKHTNYLYRAN